MAKILIAEDDVALAAAVQDWLQLEHHLVDHAATGQEALDRLAAFDYDAMILDWEMPEVSGIEVITRLRQRKGLTPILMLTGKQAVEDKEQGLDAGADDYLTKPFHMKELSARLRALLRRPSQMVSKLLQVRDLTLDPNLRKVTRNGEEIVFQPLEFDVLAFFMRHPNEVFSSEALLRRVWDSDADVSLDALYTCLKKIRKKLEVAGEPSIIRTIHGTGYRLEA